MPSPGVPAVFALDRFGGALPGMPLFWPTLFLVAGLLESKGMRGAKKFTHVV